MAKIKVQDTEITIVTNNKQDYISLTDMARSQMQEHIIFKWLSEKYHRVRWRMGNAL